MGKKLTNVKKMHIVRRILLNYSTMKGKTENRKRVLKVTVASIAEATSSTPESVRRDLRLGRFGLTLVGVSCYVVRSLLKERK